MKAQKICRESSVISQNRCSIESMYSAFPKMPSWYALSFVWRQKMWTCEVRLAPIDSYLVGLLRLKAPVQYEDPLIKAVRFAQATSQFSQVEWFLITTDIMCIKTGQLDTYFLLLIPQGIRSDGFGDLVSVASPHAQAYSGNHRYVILYLIPHC